MSATHCTLAQPCAWLPSWLEEILSGSFCAVFAAISMFSNARCSSSELAVCAKGASEPWVTRSKGPLRRADKHRCDNIIESPPKRAQVHSVLCCTGNAPLSKRDKGDLRDLVNVMECLPGGVTKFFQQYVTPRYRKSVLLTFESSAAALRAYQNLIRPAWSEFACVCQPELPQTKCTPGSIILFGCAF